MLNALIVIGSAALIMVSGGAILVFLRLAVEAIGEGGE